MCTRRRGRRSIVALRRGWGRVRVLPAGRLARRLLRHVRAVLVAADLLLLLLLRRRHIRRCGRGVHGGVPRSGPRSRVFGLLRGHVLGVPVAVAGRAGVLLLVVRVGVLHWHVTVQIAVVGVSHGIVARRVSATACGCREGQVGGATGNRGRAVSVVLGRRRQVTVWGLGMSGSSGARDAAAGYCCMPGQGREGGGGLVRGEVTRGRCRGRPERVSVHVASSGRGGGKGSRGWRLLAGSSRWRSRTPREGEMMMCEQ